MARHLTVLLSCLALGACWEVGGANTQESVLGNTATGNMVGLQLIVSRDGRHLIASGKDGRGVFAVDLMTFASVPLDLAVDAKRMAFAEEGLAYFAGGRSRTSSSGTTTTSGVVEKVSLVTGKRLASWDLPVDHWFMAYDERADRLAFWSPYRKDLHVLSPGTGALRTFEYEQLLVDVRWLPSGEERALDVPSCASRLVVWPVSDLAMLAPVDCRKDPVSLIDLRRGAFLENLPGFGPVAFSPDGETAIAFGRQADLAAFGITTATPYSLLFISTRDRGIETLDIGDALPLYSLTPDGQVVLVYSVFESASYDGIYMIDVATRTIRETTGPEVPLAEYVVTPDSRLVYLIDGGLFRLDVNTGAIDYVTIGCGGVGEPTRCNPELVNMLPDGDTLVLGWRMDPEYALFDVAREAVTRTFVVGETRPGPLAER